MLGSVTLAFRQLFDPGSSTYTYLLADRTTGEAVLIDPVFEQFARDAALLRELGLRLTHVLETHVHADHVTAAWLHQTTGGAKVGVSAAAGVSGADLNLVEGDAIRFGSHALEVLATPGHTDGCLTFVLDDGAMAFTGDCLLIRGTGRTDFQQGSPEALFESVKTKIYRLPEDCIVYPGHDYAGRTSSTVAEERRHNPRVGDAQSLEDFAGFVRNLGLPHPKKIDLAVPANMRIGKPDNGEVPNQVGWGPVHTTYAGVPEIEPAWVADNLPLVHVLDVRTADEHGEQGIPGSQVVPIDELKDRLDEVPRDKPVVVVCRSGARSARATAMLQKAGVERVANLAGGILRWTFEQPS